MVGPSGWHHIFRRMGWTRPDSYQPTQPIDISEKSNDLFTQNGKFPKQPTLDVKISQVLPFPNLIETFFGSAAT